MDTNTSAFQEAQQAVFADAGAPGSVADNIPLATGPSAFEQSTEKMERQDETSFSDNLGSMWRQDGIVDGLVAHYAGSQMLPDPTYSPFAPDEWKELSEGIQDEYLPALYEARSGAHARFIQSRLLDKQEDQQRLGDLGAWGTAGRFALGAVMPDQLLAGMVGGRIAQGLKWAKIASAPARVAGGVAAGGVGNAAFETIRQSVNFEEDPTGVLAAGLMGAAITVPFAIAGVRMSRRISDTASAESQALELLRKQSDGGTLAPQDAEALKDALEANRIVRDLESGKLDPEDAEAQYEALHAKREAASGIPGEPVERDTRITAFHGTNADFDTFDPTAKNPALFKFPDAQGIYFSPERAYAETYGKRVVETRLDLKNPKVVNESPAYISAARRAELEAEGHDGVIYHGKEGSDFPEYVVFRPEQAQAVKAPGFIDKGSIGSAQVTPVSSLAEQKTAFRDARLDIFATLNRSENPMVKKLGFGLVKDAIQVDKFDAQGWTASETKAHLTRTLKGAAMTEMKGAYREAVKARGLSLRQRLTGNFDEEFHEMVTRVTRGDTLVLQQNPDIAPMLTKASAGMRKAYDDLYAEAMAAGVKGIDQITPQDFYVNRQWHHAKMRDMERLHGRAAVEALVAGAIRVPGLNGNLKKASSFLAAVRRLEHSPALQDVMLNARDMGTLRSELASAGLTPSDIDNVVDTMFEVKAKTGGTADAGMVGNLKYRFDLDETFTVNTAGGELRISDLLENDSRMLLDTYFNSMAGHTALAKQGITSKADWDVRMKEVTDWFDGNAQHKGDSAARDVKYLQDIYNNVTGKPMSMQHYGVTERSAAAFRGYTRSIMLGQLGFAAGFELMQAAALFGGRAMYATMPSFKGFIEAARTGNVASNQLARDIAHIAGFGNEMAMSYARHLEVDDGFTGRALNRFERGANTASHAVDILSGNASITSMTRNWAGRMYTQRALDWANNPKLLEKASPTGLKAKWRERLVGWGVDDDNIDVMLAKLKQHTKAGKGNQVESIDYEAWLRDSPKSYEDFQLSMSRAARDAIQDQDLGETAMFMHSTLGKMFGELKSFFLVAHAKNMLKNAHYRDATTMQVWTIGFMGNALAYVTQTSANYAQDPEKLAEMLTLERIAKSAAFRMSAAGIAPLLANMGYAVATGGDSLVQPGMTTNTDTRSLITPSMQIAGRLAGAPQTLGGLLLGTDVTTQKEAKDLAGVIPGSRLLGISNGINYLSEMLPKSDPAKSP